MYAHYIKGGIIMTKLIENINVPIYKLVALILFVVGVFSVNSTCELIFHQSEEPSNLKRFKKNEVSK